MKYIASQHLEILNSCVSYLSEKYSEKGLFRYSVPVSDMRTLQNLISQGLHFPHDSPSIR